jgi:hypothetical protein
LKGYLRIIEGNMLDCVRVEVGEEKVKGIEVKVKEKKI